LPTAVSEGEPVAPAVIESVVEFDDAGEPVSPAPSAAGLPVPPIEDEERR
jgi:hypothetical protein